MTGGGKGAAAPGRTVRWWKNDYFKRREINFALDKF
jgi:hypothetical protein